MNIPLAGFLFKTFIYLQSYIYYSLGNNIDRKYILYMNKANLFSLMCKN